MSATTLSLRRAYRSKRLAPKRLPLTAEKKEAAAKYREQKRNSKVVTVRDAALQPKDLQTVLEALKQIPKDPTAAELKEWQRQFRTDKGVEGWKITDSTGKPFNDSLQYRLGQTTTLSAGDMKRKLMPCRNGLHFCMRPAGTNAFSGMFGKKVRLFRVWAHGKVKHSYKKSVTTHMTVVQEYNGKDKKTLCRS